MQAHVTVGSQMETHVSKAMLGGATAKHVETLAGPSLGLETLPHSPTSDPACKLCMHGRAGEQPSLLNAIVCVIMVVVMMMILITNSNNRHTTTVVRTIV